MLGFAPRTITRILLCGCAVSVLILGCRTGADVAGDGESPTEGVVLTEQQQIHRLEVLLGLTRDELETRDLREIGLGEQITVLQQIIVELETGTADLQAEIVEHGADIIELQEQSAIAAEAHDEEVEALKAERSALLLDLERLADAADRAARAARAVAAQAAAELSASVTDAAGDQSAQPGTTTAGSVNQRALADAIGGLGGFRRVDDLGFQVDARLGSRMAVTGSGLAVDSTGDVPVLFDAGLSFDSSLIYLTITDPAGRDPGMVLTIQYVSDVRPLQAQTAFISIQGNDPIDPVDPVIFTGRSERETDGVRVREAFSREVDGQLLSRISSMLSAGSFTSTFVGTAGQELHRPTVAERTAMTRMLFAYIDLGGYR